MSPPSPRQGGSVLLTLAGAAATAGALVLVPLAGTSGAAESAAPVVSSSAVGMKTTLPNFTLVTGSATSKAAASGALSAEGAGVLEPSPSGTASASASPGHSESAPRSCGEKLPAFPAPLSGAVTAGLACGSASVKSASAKSGEATASGQGASLDLDLAPLLNQVVTNGSALQSALQGVLGQLPTLPQGGESVSTVISSVENSATTDQTLQVAVGPSTSTSKIGPSSYTSTAQANGSVVTILPGGGAGGAPLAKIIVGGSSASASVGADGKVKPSAKDDPALVTVEVDSPATGAKTYSVVPGQSLTILNGTPLQTTISVGAGSVTTAPDGAVTAAAHGVAIDLAQGVGASPATSYNGGLDIELATAQATAAPTTPLLAAAHHTTPAPKPAPAHHTQLAASSVPNATVPHTGLPWAGATPLLAGGALAGGGLLYWPRLRRRLRSSRP